MNEPASSPSHRTHLQSAGLLAYWRQRDIEAPSSPQPSPDLRGKARRPKPSLIESPDLIRDLAELSRLLATVDDLARAIQEQVGDTAILKLFREIEGRLHYLRAKFFLYGNRLPEAKAELLDVRGTLESDATALLQQLASEDPSRPQ